MHTVSDLMAIAATEKALQRKLIGEWVRNTTRLGTAGTFSTAVEQVKPAIEVSQEKK